MCEEHRGDHTLDHALDGGVDLDGLEDLLHPLDLPRCLNDFEQTHQLGHPVESGQARQSDQLVVVFGAAATRLGLVKELLDQVEGDDTDKIEGEPRFYIATSDELGTRIDRAVRILRRLQEVNQDVDHEQNIHRPVDRLIG